MLVRANRSQFDFAITQLVAGLSADSTCFGSDKFD